MIYIHKKSNFSLLSNFLILHNNLISTYEKRSVTQRIIVSISCSFPFIPIESENCPLEVHKMKFILIDEGCQVIRLQLKVRD